MPSCTTNFATFLPSEAGRRPDVTCCENSRYIELFSFSCENPERAPALAGKGRLRQSEMAWKLASVPFDYDIVVGPVIISYN